VIETEYAIDPGLYDDLRRCYGIGREIEKRRHVAACAGDRWEIDVYDGAFAGLVVAEIELDDPGRPVRVPEAFGRGSKSRRGAR